MTKERKKITIRPFKQEDYNAVSNIVFDAFKNKFRCLANIPDKPLISLLKALNIIEYEPHEGYIVAEQEGKIVGIMLLDFKGISKEKKETDVALLPLFKQYGFFRIIKLLLGVSLLKESLCDGECYIEHIAVDQTARGLGIGTQLIAYGKNYIVNNSTLKDYTLHVSAKNTDAISLYQRLGFNIKKTRTSILTHLFIKEKTWLYMSQNIKKNVNKS